MNSLVKNRTAGYGTISFSDLTHVENDWIQTFLLERFENGWIAFCNQDFPVFKTNRVAPRTPLLQALV